MQRSRTQTEAIKGQIIWLNLLVAARRIRRKVGSRISKKGSIVISLLESSPSELSFSSRANAGGALQPLLYSTRPVVQAKPTVPMHPSVQSHVDHASRSEAWETARSELESSRNLVRYGPGDYGVSCSNLGGLAPGGTCTVMSPSTSFRWRCARKDSRSTSISWSLFIASSARLGLTF